MIRAVPALLSLLIAAACQHQAPNGPAVLTDTSSETLGTLKAQLAGALGKASIELGAGDLSQVSTFVIAPPPLGPNETHSPVKPIRFQLMIEGKTCYAKREDTGEKVILNGVTCRAA